MQAKRIELVMAFVLGMLGAAATAPAQQGERPGYGFRHVSPSGRRYVLTTWLRPTWFAFCERAEGAAPVGPGEWRHVRSGRQGVKTELLVRDPADRLLASGKVDFRTIEVVVPDRLDGFLLLGRDRSPNSVTWVDGTGEIVFSLSARDIFGGVPKGVSLGRDSLGWRRDDWLDEEPGSIVLVTLGDEVREVAVPDGKVTAPGRERVMALLRAASARHRASLLHAYSRREPAELVDVAAEVEERYFGEGNPIEVRLSAGVLLARAGVSRLREATAALFAAARGKEHAEEIRRYAVRWLADVIGDDAIPTLRALLRGGDPPPRCREGFVNCGSGALPTLVAMLGETEESVWYRDVAAVALCDLLGGMDDAERERWLSAAPTMRQVLFLAVATMEVTVARSAEQALERLGGDDLASRFSAMLDKGTTVDYELARFLWDHPTRAALSAIDAALARARDSSTIEALRLAREACAKSKKGQE